MANETATKGGKAALKVLAPGQEVERAATAPDGTVTIAHARGKLQSVDIADVDLLLSFSDGSYVIIPNGALDALGAEAHTVVFADGKSSLAQVFKMAGQAIPAKAGSLRLVSENIDAAKPPADEAPPEEKPATEPPAPPAPMVKVSAGTTLLGKGPGLGGSGYGEGEGEVPATVVPLVTPNPPVFRAGQKTQNIEDLLTGIGLGQPSFSVALYTSANFKVIPAGRTELPLGAYDPTADTSQLAERASPAKQALREAINGTAGADTIDINPAFSASEGQWTKTLHLKIDNFSDLTSIQLVFNAAKIALIPGFNLQGIDGAVVTRDSATSNSWHVTPSADMLLKGVDIAIVYNISDSAAPVDFGADVVIEGHAGPYAFEVVNNLDFTWRDAVTQADFTVTSSTGVPLMVLPRAGTGVEVFAGEDNDRVNAGAGPDIVHGEAGNDTLSGGRGNDVLDGGLGADSLDGGAGTDTATYATAANGVTASLDSALGVGNTNDAAGDSYANIENLQGSDFNDLLIGDAQANMLIGGGGDDKLVGRGNGDTFDGGAGNDTASYEYATDAVVVSLTTNTGTAGEANGDVLISVENLTGGAGNDTFTGAAGNQANAFDGRAGSDTVSYAPSTTGVVVSLTAGLGGVAQTNDAAGDTFTSIENLTGSSFADTLIGDGAGNILTGEGGTNTLEGMGGADTFVGGVDIDTVSYAHSTGGVVSSMTTAFVAGLAVVQSGDAAGDTYSGIENMIGTDSADTLIGNGSANRIAGGLGDDVVEGMAGADELDGGAGNNTASYAHAALTLGTGGVLLGVTASLSGPGSNTGDAQGDSYTNIQNLLGSDYNDTLTGNSGANTLTGGSGSDILEGLSGADVLDGGSGTDTATYASASTAVVASLAVAADNTGVAAGDSYTSIENLTGGGFADTLVGDGGANVITGGAGNDVLEGMAGADVLAGGTGTNTVTFAHAGLASYAGGLATDIVGNGVAASLTVSFASGDAFSQSGDAAGDTYSGIVNIVGSDYADTLIGDGAANVISGGSGDDILEGMGGADTLEGGAGNNTASYNHAAAQAGGVGVLASLDVSYANTGEAAGDTYVDISRLTGSTYNDTLIGNSAANTLNGGAGDDVLEGQGGADVLQGGAGSNTASYAHASAVGGTIASLINPASNTGDAAGDTYNLIQNLTGSNYGDTLTGDTASNILNGGAGNDLLDGGAGLNGDTFIGGSELDTVTYVNATTGVTSVLATSFTAGASVLQAGDATGDTYSGIENLTGSGFADTLIGDSGSNTLTGGAGADVLEGMAAADALIGGAVGDPADADDTASYAHATVAVLASLTLTTALTTGPVVSTAGDAVGDTYTSIENLAGGIYADTLIGDGAVNTLSGDAGNDVLEGLAGADVLNGGADTDTASYIHATAAVVASLTTGLVTATGDAAGDSYVSIENMRGTTLADTLIGDVAANTLWGDTGDDVIEGYSGGDVIDGGLGSDTASYAHATAAVTASLTASFSVGPAVTQSGDANGDSYVSIENVVGSDFADTLIGNVAANSLSGGASDDVLEGIAGGDTYDGGTGNNTVSYAHAAADVTTSLLTPLDATGNLGAAAGDLYTNIQNLTGSNFNDSLEGDASNNILTGGTGNDTLTAGAGTDTLYGGTGNDTLIDDGVGAARLYGEGGADIFSITSADTGVDVIDGGDKSALRQAGTWTNASDGDTIIWNPSTAANRIDVDMNTHLILVRTPVNGNYISFANVENFSVTGNNSIYATLDNYSNVIDATTNGVANIDYADYRYALGSISADLRISSGVNVTGGSSVLDNLNTATSRWTGAGDTLKGIEYLYGGSLYADNIYGSDGVNNWLAGALGADYINGGTGSDTVYLDPNRSQTVVASLLSTAQNSTMGIVMSDAAQGDVYVGIENLYSSGGLDQLYGNAGDNILSSNGIMEGFAGADNLTSLNGLTATASYANAGDSRLAGITTGTSVGVTANLTSPGGAAFTNGFAGGPGGASSTSGLGTVVANTGDAAGDSYANNMYKLTGSNFADILIGNTLANTITGNAGDDLMEGLGGVDTFIGGIGIDTVSYAHATGPVLASLLNSTSNTGTDATGDVYSGIENLIGSTFGDTLVGDSFDNVLNGGAGNDVLDGSFGFNTASYAYTPIAGVTVSLAITVGQNTVSAGTDTLTNIQGLIGSSFNDTLTGDGTTNVIDGGLGADTLDGAGGTDTVAYTSATGSVTAILNGANSQTDLMSNFENMLGSLYSDDLTGDAQSNIIEGDLGNDTLEGGANTASGDTVSYSLATAGVTVNLATTAAQNTVAAGTDTLTGFENLTGSGFGDTLTGNASINVITGGLGDDVLVASGGGDTLAGGGGTDTASYAGSGMVTVTINGTAVHDAVTDTLTSIENLIGSANADNITGDGGNNVIDGGLGDDTISGGGGTDTITYVNAAAAVLVDLSAGGANVSGAYGADRISLFENIIGSIGNDTLTGDGNDNLIEGGAGDDLMNGGAGNDIASYSTAASAVTVSLAMGTAQNTGGAGTDTLSLFEGLTGSAFNDTLTGSTSADTLDGGAGDDVLMGGAAGDFLTGGNGSDTVSYVNSGAVTVNLTSSAYRGVNHGAVYSGKGGAGEASGDTYNGIENVIGSANNDALMGTVGSNVITGGGGDDLMWGDNGNDVIYANQGSDTAYGENDNDTFYVSSLLANLPTIIDGGGRDAGYVQNHGGNVMVLQNLVNGGTYAMSDLASLNTRLVNIDTLNIRGDGAATTMTISSQDIINMVDTVSVNSNVQQLYVKADTGDVLNLSLTAGQTVGYSEISSAADGSIYRDYTIFNSSMATVAQIHWHAA